MEALLGIAAALAIAIATIGPGIGQGLAASKANLQSIIPHLLPKARMLFGIKLN